MSSQKSHINQEEITKRFFRRINSLIILLCLHLILLNSINFFSYVSLINADSLKENNKTLIEALADNFIKVPETEKDNSEDINESDEVLAYSLDNFALKSFSVNYSKKRNLFHAFYGTPLTDVTTPPPKECKSFYTI